MSTALLPGFNNPVHDAQTTFRSLLEALSHPGQPYRPTVRIAPPSGLAPLCAAACLTLIDLETVVWLQPSLPSAVEDWLRFHTGCRFTQDPSSASFAVIEAFSAEIVLDAFNWGSAEYPEQSTTLLIQTESQTENQTESQTESQTGDEPKMLSGPGIRETISFLPALPSVFWQQWIQNNAAYPRGVDCFLFTQDSVVGLPRTTHIDA